MEELRGKARKRSVNRYAERETLGGERRRVEEEETSYRVRKARRKL